MTRTDIAEPNGRLFSHEAVTLARTLAEVAGFRVEGMSESSLAVYMARPGRVSRLRIAGHAHAHANIAAEIIMADTTLDHVVVEFSGECDGAPFTDSVEVEVRHTGLFPDDVAELVAEAIAEYDATPEEE